MLWFVVKRLVILRRLLLQFSLTAFFFHQEINIIALECIGYDEYFANDMLRHLGQPQGTAGSSSSSKGNADETKLVPKVENKNEDKKLCCNSRIDIPTKSTSGSSSTNRIDVDKLADSSQQSSAFDHLNFYESDGELTELEDD